MAAPHPLLSDQGYRNWLRDTLSLLYLKEALVKIVDHDAMQFHQGLQRALGVVGAAPSTCSSCNQNDIIKDFRQRKWWITCPLCDQWLQQIVQNHANQPLPNLHRENTDPQLWPTNPYEVFKCYMPYGCQQDQSAKDADSQSILNVLKNCVYFSTCGRIGRLNLVDQLLEIRNSLFHSGNFLVDDPKLHTDMQTMLAFLRGLTALSGVEQSAVDEAIDKILQLQANKIDLSLNRLELTALQQQQIALERDHATTKAKGEATDAAVKTIQSEVDTHSTKLLTVDSDMKSLQKDVSQAKTKGAATDLTVKTIQSDVNTHTTKLLTVDSDMKSLQKDVSQAKTKGAATDTAVETIQSEVDTHSTKLLTVDSDMKILQKDVSQAKTKGAATDVAVKTIQSDVDTHSTKLLTVDSDMKSLQKAVTSATVKGEATDTAVKTIQSDVVKHSTKLLTVDSDMKSLQKDVTSAKAKGAATELDVKKLTEETKGLELRMQKQLADQGSTCQDQMTTLYQRQQQTETGLQAQQEKSQAHQSRIQSLQTGEVAVRAEQATLRTEQVAVRTEQVALRTEQVALRTEQVAVRAEQGTLRTEQMAVRAEQATLRTEQGTLRTEQVAVRAEQATLRTEQVTLRTEQATTSSILQGHEIQLAELQAQKDSRQETTVTSEEMDIADLQAALIKHYRDHHLMVPNPIVAAELGLDEIYVPPDIKVLGETKNPRTGLINVQDRATPANTLVCKQLFYTEDYRCKNVYITSDAGMGKTMFSKHLVNLWCRAQSDKLTSTSARCDSAASSQQTDPSDPPSAASSQQTDPSDCPGIELDDSDSDRSDYDDSDYDDSDSDRSDFDSTVDVTEDDIRTMSHFQLLFYITLRNSSNKYDIADMIDAQILRHIKFKTTLKAVDLLQNEGCLVIIDGLDEWVCPEGVDVPHFVNPGIPGRMGLNSNTVYLTTTRPWKFDVLKLKGYDVDKHVELKGLNKKSSKQLCSKIIRLLSGCENVTKARNVWDVWAELKKKGLSHLHNVPVILTQLICLFFDKQELSNSQVQLYCSMIEMLLKRPDKGLPEPTLTVSQNTDRSEKLLPECFSKYRSCQVHQHLLVTLAKIAFEALFNEERENSLVFDSSQMTIFGVDQEDIDLCLKAGILSQNKVLGKWSVCEKRMSFLHKKLQEFLAAIFITNSHDTENVLSRVKGYCSTVETVLEMSEIFMFVCGLKPDVVCKLLTDLMTRVVFNDTAVQQYRQDIDDPDNTCIHSIQTCIVDCIVEATSNGHSGICLPLQDFIIGQLGQWTISECLKSLMTSNIANVKSVYINTYNMTSDNVEFVARTLHQLQDTRCLQKLYLDDDRNVISDKTLSKTITNSSNLSSLVLQHISLGTETRAAVCGALKHLTALKLVDVNLPHKETQLLVSSLSSAALRQLSLRWLHCTDHGRYCRPGIDLSQLHSHSCLQDIILYRVTIQARQLQEFVRRLSSVSHKVTVKLAVRVPADSGHFRADLDFLTNDRSLVVTNLEYNDWNNTWDIEFHTQQQTTT